MLAPLFSIALTSVLSDAPAAPGAAATVDAAGPTPAFVEWDTGSGGSEGLVGTAWIPVCLQGRSMPTSEQFQWMVKEIKAESPIGDCGPTYTIVGTGAQDGGIAGTNSVVFTLTSVPADIVMPVIQATQAVADYINTQIAFASDVNIKIAFQTLSSSLVAVASPRVSILPVSPSLASLIASGSSAANLDDARFLPNPPSPYGTGPVLNSKIRTYYSNIQANGKNRYTSEGSLVWSTANLRAAWIYALPGLSTFDGTVTFTSETTNLARFDFDPADGIPVDGISYQDWLLRLTLINMGWLSSIQTNLTSEACILDLYRFRNDIVAEDTNGNPASLPTDFGYLTQEPGAWVSTFPGIDCTDVSDTLTAVINNGGTFSDPLLGLFSPDYNPGGYRKFRTVLAGNSPFADTSEQAAFVSSNFGTALPGFSQYGTAMRNQFGGPGIIDDQQLVPAPPVSVRTRFVDCIMPEYVTNSGFCFLIDYNPTFPGYYSRFVVRGLNLAPGEVILNYVTGLDGSTTNDAVDGVDFELTLIDDTNASAGFLDAAVLMGLASIPDGTTFFPNFLSPSELKVVDCLGWDVP